MAETSEAQRREMIASAAYFRAERRGFRGGDPVADWLEAEAEVDAAVSKQSAVAAALEHRLVAVNETIQRLDGMLGVMKSGATKELSRDVQKLAKLRDTFRKRVEELRVQGDHSGEKLRHQAEKAWSQLARAVDRLTNEKPERVE